MAPAGSASAFTNMIDRSRNQLPGDKLRHFTCYGQLGVGNVRATHHAVVALVPGVTVLDFQAVEVVHTGDLVLVTVVQFLGSFVPGEGDLWVVDLNSTLEDSALVLSCLLVSDVLQHRHRLKVEERLSGLVSLCLWSKPVSD